MWIRGCSVCLCLLWMMHNTSALPLTTLPPRTKTTPARSNPTRRPTTRHILSSLRPTSRRKTAPSRTSRRSTTPRRTMRLTTLTRVRRTKTPLVITTRRPKLSTKPSRPTTRKATKTPLKKRPRTGSPLGAGNPTEPTEGQIHRCPCMKAMKTINSTKPMPLQAMEDHNADLCPCHSDMGEAQSPDQTTQTAPHLMSQFSESNLPASASHVEALPPPVSQPGEPPVQPLRPPAQPPLAPAPLAQPPPPAQPLPPLAQPPPPPAQPLPPPAQTPPSPGQPPPPPAQLSPPQQALVQTSSSSSCPCPSQIEIYETTAICPCDETHSEPSQQQQEVKAKDSLHQQPQYHHEQQPESAQQQPQQQPVSTQQEAQQQPQQQPTQQSEPAISPNVASYSNTLKLQANCPCAAVKNKSSADCPCKEQSLVSPMPEHCQCRGNNEPEHSNCSCAYAPLQVRPGVCPCEDQRESPKCHCEGKEQWTPGCQCTSHISSPVSPSCTCHDQGGGSHQGHPLPTIPPECLCHPSDMNNCFCDF